MFRLLLALAAYAALTVSGFAQVLQELTPTQTIKIYPGESKLFSSPQGITAFHLSDPEIISLTLEGNQTFSLVAKKPGQVMLSIYGDGERLLLRTTVISAGSLVRMYGTQKRDATDEKDYVGYICTDVSCGRADPELERQSTTSVVRTRRTPGGDIVTTTRGN